MPETQDPAFREVVIRLQATVETLDKTVTRLVEKTVSLEAHQALEKRVEDIEGSVTWVTRIVVGAVILALLGLVIFQGGGEIPS